MWIYMLLNSEVSGVDAIGSKSSFQARISKYWRSSVCCLFLEAGSVEIVCTDRQSRDLYEWGEKRSEVML